MSHKPTRQILTIAILVVALSSAVAAANVSVELRFREMEPHVGQAFFLRFVNIDTGVEFTRLAMPSIPSGSFELEVDGLQSGASYRIDFFADVNGDGIYSIPPEDHAWRIDLLDVQADGILTFAHNTTFTDIDWAPSIDGRIDEGEYANTLHDEETGMSVYWHNDASSLTIGLVSPGAGWLSIGFEPERQMQGANIIIGSIVDGVLTIEDHYGNSPTSHRQDAVDDIVRAEGSEIDGMSVLEFAIPLDSGDDQDKVLTSGSELVIILAYHDWNDGLTARHSKRSTRAILLRN